MDGASNFALGSDPKALCPQNKSISKAFKITYYYLMLKEFFTSRTILWESQLHHRKFLYLVEVTVLFPKQNKTKADSELRRPLGDLCSVQLFSSPCVWHPNTGRTGNDELLPGWEEQNLLLVHWTQMRASYVPLACILLQPKPLFRKDSTLRQPNLP